MTDRELLEKAAKAAGIEVIRSRLDDPLRRDMLARNSDRNAHQESGSWNPLTDDGDALRLANKLWLQVRHVHGQAHVGKPDEFWCTEPWFPDGDQNAATRRAIVRAAAAMADEKEHA